MAPLDGLQGNVLEGYRTPHALYVFAKVRNGPAARSWLAERLCEVTTYRSWSSAPSELTFNVAFGYQGLIALGVPEIRLSHLEAFREGMAARADQLGDVGPNASEHWEAGLRDSHVLLVLTARVDAALARAAGELRDSLDEAGALTITREQDAHQLHEDREHFGFQDGFSQPAVAGAKTGPRVGEGTLTRWRRWRDLALGEFVLGYRDEGGRVAPAPLGPLGDEASFMVLRKLAQDVAGFRRYTEEAAATLGRDPAWLRAKMIGRWQNGSSLARYPQAPGPAAVDDRKASRFRYGGDPDGFACPLGSHVRRANPRDALGWQGRLTERHRIIRRGMSYGSALPAGGEADQDGERGLIFVAYQADLERQFEFIQRQWLGDGNALRLGSDRDPLLASEARDGGMVIQGNPPLFLTGLPGFVTTRGGGYFLLPGRTGLRALVAGSC
jgi:Dyp-type peroxidase family